MKYCEVELGLGYYQDTFLSEESKIKESLRDVLWFIWGGYKYVFEIQGRINYNFFKFYRGEVEQGGEREMIFYRFDFGIL